MPYYLVFFSFFYWNRVSLWQVQVTSINLPSTYCQSCKNRHVTGKYKMYVHCSEYAHFLNFVRIFLKKSEKAKNLLTVSSKSDILNATSSHKTPRLLAVNEKRSVHSALKTIRRSIKSPLEIILIIFLAVSQIRIDFNADRIQLFTSVLIRIQEAEPVRIRILVRLKGDFRSGSESNASKII